MDRSTFTGQTFETMAAAMYEDRATIKRRVSTKGPDGGNLISDQILASDVPIRIRPSSAQEKEIAGATQGSTAYTIRIPAWQGPVPIRLDSDCFLDIAARGEVEARSLSIVAPLPGTGSKLDAVAVGKT